MVSGKFYIIMNLICLVLSWFHVKTKAQVCAEHHDAAFTLMYDDPAFRICSFQEEPVQNVFNLMGNPHSSDAELGTNSHLIFQ
jgi:hypothetical protein